MENETISEYKGYAFTIYAVGSPGGKSYVGKVMDVHKDTARIDVDFGEAPGDTWQDATMHMFQKLKEWIDSQAVPGAK